MSGLLSGLFGGGGSSGGRISRLKPASYRGVKFYVDDAGGTHGRRFADHQYPGRDVPYAEDLGREQRVWGVSGYVLGPNYQMTRDALIRACERKGAGVLIHPATGRVQAVCRTVAWNETRDAGGRCNFQIEFAEPGKLTEPSGLPDTEQRLEVASDNLGVAAEGALTDIFNVEDALSYVGEFAGIDVQAVSVALERMRMPASGMDQSAITESLNDLYDDAMGLVHDPLELAQRTAGVFADFSNSGDAYSVGVSMLSFAGDYVAGNEAVNVVPPISPFAASAMAASVAPRAAAPPGTEYSSSGHLAINQGAWQRFVREQALRELGYLTPAMDVTSHEEADKILDEMTRVFDSAETAAADAGEDDVYLALIDLRAAIMADIATRRGTIVPLVVYRMQRTTNAITMAWRFYHDANRDLEMVDAVHAYTPAFMPISGRIKAH